MFSVRCSLAEVLEVHKYTRTWQCNTWNRWNADTIIISTTFPWCELTSASSLLLIRKGIQIMRNVGSLCRFPSVKMSQFDETETLASVQKHLHSLSFLVMNCETFASLPFSFHEQHLQSLQFAAQKSHVENDCWKRDGCSKIKSIPVNEVLHFLFESMKIHSIYNIKGK